MPLARDNHYVPQLYLKQFSSDEDKLFAYRILVPKPRVPIWKRYHVAGIGYQRHLYTRIFSGHEADDIEIWLNRSFEVPAEQALRKAICDERLTPNDYKVLGRFVAAQAVRTPAFFIKNLPRWRSWAEQEMKESSSRIRARLEEAKETGIPIAYESAPNKEYFPIKVTRETSDLPNTVRIKTETVVGRAYWLFAMRHMLTHTLDKLSEHHWTILEAPTGLPWFTTDDPVIQLNYHSPSKYDFGGGWGSLGTEIILPLSPRHLLYTKIGQRPPARGTVVSSEQANWFRRLIAEHAHRHIFSPCEEDGIPKLRPRIVNEEAFSYERAEWAKWHKEQSEVEHYFMKQQ